MKLVLGFLFMLSIGVSALAQREGPFSIAVMPKTGLLLAHRATMTHLVQKRTVALELEFSRQDTSRSVWSSIYRYPSRGTSILYQDYGNQAVLGSSFTFFRFTKFPIFQSEKWGFIDFRLGNGISYITKKYDQFNNPKNIAIGSYINGFVNLQFSYTKNFKHFHIGTGVDFSHISNASIKTPNQGLNTFTVFMNAGINLSRRQVYDQLQFPKDTLPAVRVFSKWQVHFVFSLKQNLPGFYKPRNFGVAALQGLYRIPVSNIWDFETGIDLVYNEANRWFYDVEPAPIYQGFLLGGYAGMAMSLYQTQLYFGLGAYAFNMINPAGWIYNRIGLRFITNEHWNFSIGIKAHVGVADYLEWGLGYRF